MDAAADASPLNEDLQNRRKLAHRKGVPLLAAILIQGFLLLGSVAVVVVLPSLREDPAFIAKKTIYLPQRELEHQAAVAEFQQAATSPMTVEKLTTESLIPQDLPDLPSLPTETFAVLESETPSPNAEGLLQGSGLMGALSGLNAGSSEFNFLGVKDEASRIVICFDISVTVVNSVEAAGMQMTDLRDATIEVIQGLNANTLFGIIQHSRNFDVYENYLMPATVANKEKAIEWLRSEFRTNGSGQGWNRLGNENGIEAVMQVAFRMEPDVIFMVSDGGYYRSYPQDEAVPFEDLRDLIDELQDPLPEPVRLHFIGFGVREDDRVIGKGIRNIINRYGGRYREY